MYGLLEDGRASIDTGRVVVPESSDIFLLTRVRCSFFNPATGVYRRITVFVNRIADSYCTRTRWLTAHAEFRCSFCIQTRTVNRQKCGGRFVFENGRYTYNRKYGAQTLLISIGGNDERINGSRIPKRRIISRTLRRGGTFRFTTPARSAAFIFRVNTFVSYFYIATTTVVGIVVTRDVVVPA